jgi:hypothetical protein
MSQQHLVANQTVELLDPVDGAQELERLSRFRRGLAEVLREVDRRGYRPLDGQLLGYRITATAREEVTPPSYVNDGRGVREVSFEFLLQSYSRGDDQAAAGTMTVTAGEYTEEYNVILEAPRGDFMRVREYAYVDGSVVEVDGWWDRFNGCLGRSCGSACLGAVVTCAKDSFWTFLLCVVAKCGLCIAGCFACATCNCHWICSWLFGCCQG